MEHQEFEPDERTNPLGDGGNHASPNPHQANGVEANEEPNLAADLPALNGEHPRHDGDTENGNGAGQNPNISYPSAEEAEGAEEAEQAERANIPADIIELCIKNAQGQITHFRIKRTMLFKKLFHAYAGREGLNLETLRFLFDGNKLQPDQNANDTEMENGDVIDVVLEQVGGA